MEGPLIIPDVSRVEELIARLRETDRPFTFYNREKTIRYCMNTCETGESHKHKGPSGYSVAISHDTSFNSEAVERVVEYNESTEFEEEIEDMMLIAIRFFQEDASEGYAKIHTSLLKILQQCLNKKICHCENYFIYDSHDLCFRCGLLRKDVAEEDLRDCSICARVVHKDMFQSTACCSQDLCKDCVDKCTACPYCRKPFGDVTEPLDEVAERSRMVTSVSGAFRV